MYGKLKNAGNLRDICPKNYQNARIFMICVRKIDEISEFYMIFARKIFSRILGGGAHSPQRCN